MLLFHLVEKEKKVKKEIEKVIDLEETIPSMEEIKPLIQVKEEFPLEVVVGKKIVC